VRLLVIIGGRANGRKDWSRSPTDSANPPSCGRTCSTTPNAAVWPRRCSRLGDGARVLKAVRDVFHRTTDRRSWWRKIGDVLNCPPHSAQPRQGCVGGDLLRAGQDPHPGCGEGVRRRVKWPKAAAKITSDLDVPHAFRCLATGGCHEVLQPHRVDPSERNTRRFCALTRLLAVRGYGRSQYSSSPLMTRCGPRRQQQRSCVS